MKRRVFCANDLIEEAIAMAREGHGGGMSLTYQKIPPVYVCRVAP